MKCFNRIEAHGVLGSDAEVRTINDKKVANFSVATEYHSKRSDGSFAIETTWIKVCAWEGFGMTDFSLLKKGTKVCVSGRLRSREYTDKQGENHSVLEILADSLDVIQDTRQEPRQNSARKPQYQPAGGFPQSGDDDIF